MNFSLQQEPAPTPPATMRDLPSLQRPRRRKASPRTKAKALAAVAVLGLGAVGAVLAGAVGTGTPLSVSGLKSWFRPSTNNILTAPVRRGDLAITVTEKGNLESAKNEDVTCEVEGQTQILKILQE